MSNPLLGELMGHSLWHSVKYLRNTSTAVLTSLCYLHDSFRGIEHSINICHVLRLRGDQSIVRERGVVHTVE